MAPTASAAIVLRDLPPPAEQPSCVEAWELRKDLSQVIFGLDWHNNYLAACTSTGHILIWLLNDDDEKEDFTMDDEYPSKKPRKERRNPDLK
jgi:hypothetical protein